MCNNLPVLQMVGMVDFVNVTFEELEEKCESLFLPHLSDLKDEIMLLMPEKEQKFHDPLFFSIFINIVNERFKARIDFTLQFPFSLADYVIELSKQWPEERFESIKFFIKLYFLSYFQPNTAIGLRMFIELLSKANNFGF